MKSIDWKAKLSSRRFWAAVVGFVTAVLVACNFNHITVEQVAAIITAGGVLIAYILGESAVDKARAEAQAQPEELVEAEPEPQEVRQIGCREGDQ